MKLGIKVDVDTLRGYAEGMPRMLDLFGELGIKASIFFSFGPDNSGKAIRRIFRPGFLSKMFRTKAPTTYGFKTLLYGTLLPAPLIVESDGGIFKRAVSSGHDCGVHAWDHVLVQDKLASMSAVDFETLYRRAESLFQSLSGFKPCSYAAPGWQVSEVSLTVEERLGLKYASDTRGHSPFYPQMNNREYAVPQVPTTLPTMDEVLGLDGMSDAGLIRLWLDGLKYDWNVLTVHAEMEGMSKLGLFRDFLTTAAAEGVEFITLAQIASSPITDRAEIREGTVAGRAGLVALQV